jgi:YidC/Oxa1 family membrane protein insertase
VCGSGRGFWPGLLRAVVFVSFLFVLWNFTSEVRPNPVLDQAARDSFLRTDIFGAGLDNWISQFGTDRMDVLAVGGSLLLASVVTTFVPAWISIRQAAITDIDRNSAIVNTVGLTLMPVCQLVPGLFLPVSIGVLLYMLVSNVWWFAESVLVRRKVDRDWCVGRPDR